MQMISSEPSCRIRLTKPTSWCWEAEGGVSEAAEVKEVWLASVPRVQILSGIWHVLNLSASRSSFGLLNLHISSSAEQM